MNEFSNQAKQEELRGNKVLFSISSMKKHSLMTLMMFLMFKIPEAFVCGSCSWEALLGCICFGLFVVSSLALYYFVYISCFPLSFFFPLPLGVCIFWTFCSLFNTYLVKKKKTLILRPDTIMLIFNTSTIDFHFENLELFTEL